MIVKKLMTKRLPIKPLITLFVLLILRGGTLFAQDPMFSQFYASPLQLNPALTGSAEAPFIALNYRSQFPSFQDGAAYSTFAASYDQHLSGLNSGIGLSLMADDAGQGILRKIYASLHYSYKVTINDDLAARIGVEAGIIQNRVDWDKLIFPDQLDPLNGAFNLDGSKRFTAEIQPNSLTNTLFDLSTGVVFYGSKFFAGVSAKHLATPNEGFLNVNDNLRVGLPIRWSLHGGYEITLTKPTRFKQGSFLTPTIMYVKQGDFGQIMAGAYGGFGAIVAGFYYRHANTNPGDVISVIGFKHEYFKVSYSYDFSVGSLGGRTGGSHEVSLLINLDPGAAKRVDLGDCFKIFR